MENLKIEKTKTTPRIDFDAKLNTLSISGDIYPEDADKFFNPIFDWLQRYLLTLHYKCIVSIHLQYFNTAASGRISHFLELLEKTYKRGKDISIHWYYEPDNDEMEEVAEEFREGITIPFQIIEKRL
ncbi:MAG: DUF1987 domain-containing protein [Leptospiraceae bacterium]|jgi:ADP-heptose:LPS heptosyltransferase|nr:DUF1987 domain-containing protein [Leptospiraceae bacterium]MBP9889997.1 DUF1987 domain-containing protein [Leptospiraceae bacterium]